MDEEGENVESLKRCEYCGSRYDIEDVLAQYEKRLGEMNGNGIKCNI